MSNDIDTDRPASEQFDLSNDVDVDTDELEQLAHDLESVADDDPSDHDGDPGELADIIAALKRLESAAEDARKDIYEEVLDTYVSEGETIHNLQKRRGSSTYVTDAEGAFAAVADAGADPLDVASVKVSDLRDVLGADADDYLGASEYSYFARQS